MNQKLFELNTYLMNTISNKLNNKNEIKLFDINHSTNLSSSNSNCHLYEKLEYTNCEYIEKYGNKYCNIYLNKEPELSEIGQKWSKNIRQCLQDNVLTIIQNTSSCSVLMKEAIHGHVGCYLDGPISFFDMPFTDQLTIIRNASWDLEALKTGLEIYSHYPDYLYHKYIKDDLSNQSTNIHSYNQQNNLNYVDEILYDTQNPSANNMTLIDYTKLTSFISNNQNNTQQVNNQNMSIKDVQYVQNTLITLNTELMYVNKLIHFHDLTKHQQIVLISSIIAFHYRHEIQKLLHDDSGILTNILLNYLQSGKIKIKEIALNIGELQTNLPLHGIFMIFNSLSHHGKHMKEALITTAKDGICCIAPQLKIALLIQETLQIIQAIFTHTKVINVHGFSVLRTKSIDLNIFSSKFGDTIIELDCDALDIHIKKEAWHKSSAEKNALNEFNQQAYKKTYQIFFVDYDYFDNENKNKNQRIDTYKQAIDFELSKKMVKKFNHFNEKQMEKYENALLESETHKNKRLTYEILDKKFSYFEKNGNIDVYHFMCNLFYDISLCKNNEERAEFLYSFIYETGATNKNEEVHFSPLFSYLLNCLNINSNHFEDYINHQNHLNEKDLNKKIEDAKVKEFKDLNKELIDLRNKRTNQENNDISNINETNKKHKKDGTQEYSNSEIQKFAHSQLLNYEISALYVFQNMYFSIQSNMVYTIVYFDKEYEKMKYYQSAYASMKVTELALNSVQSYTSNVVANHITMGLSLMETFQNISDEAFQYLISPNVSILTSLGMSSLLNINNDELKEQSYLQQSYYITENAMKVNIVNIIQYNKLMNYDLVHELAYNLGNTIAQASHACNSFDILHATHIYAHVYHISHVCDTISNLHAIHDLTIISAKATAITLGIEQTLHYLLGSSTLGASLIVMTIIRLGREIIFADELRTERTAKYLIQTKSENLKQLNYVSSTIKNIQNINSNLKKNPTPMMEKCCKSQLQRLGLLPFKAEIKHNKIPTVLRNAYCNKPLTNQNQIMKNNISNNLKNNMEINKQKNGPTLLRNKYCNKPI
jgi:hypothetical protein